MPQRPRPRRMQNTQRKHAATVVVCMCARLHGCNTIVSLHICERFCLKLKNLYFKWISDCLPVLSMNGGSPTLPRNMIITFILYIFCKKDYCNTSEVIRNFIHQQHPSRFKIPLNFWPNKGILSNDLYQYIPETPTLESMWSFKFLPSAFSVL